MSHPETKKARQICRRKKNLKIKKIALRPNSRIITRGYPQYVDDSLRQYNSEITKSNYLDFLNWTFMQGPYQREPFFIKQYSGHGHCKLKRYDENRHFRHSIANEIFSDLIDNKIF